MEKYLASIASTAATGKATEHSYRAAVESLFHRLYPHLEITNEPRRQACGAPDFLVQRKGVPFGYIEAKDIDKDLNSIEFKEQFSRYKHSLDNLLITNYLHWQLWRRGELVLEVRIGEYTKGQPVKARPQDYSQLEVMLQVFTTAKAQRISSPETLAQLMAEKAQMLQHVLHQALDNPETDPSSDPSGLGGQVVGSLESQFKAFKQMLIHDLTAEQFADIYAQTITYGLFAARLNDTTPDTFSRQEALTLVPASNPFLRKLFSYVAGTELDERVVWIVDALAELFRAADVAALLRGFGQNTQMTDPFLYFYETFLGRYNPVLKKSRGVYYTPQPVVRFIVRAVDEVLKREFDLPDGLADTAKTKVQVQVPEIKNKKPTGKNVSSTREVARVQVLDPATGTGTFLAEVVRHIHARLGGSSFWNQYVEKHLIPRLHGFEIMMASYAMCHLKLSLLLQQLGYKSKKNTPPRLSIYLTNALEEAHPDTHTLFASWLSDESNQANLIKRNAPVMVVLGNPPYSGESKNTGDWISGLIRSYKREPTGGPLQERNSKWLNNDYVKFMRLGQEHIERNGEGILAFITSNSFLDNPTFRGMRYDMLTVYDTIYIVDLHGNSKKKERAPDGSKDENVFDIQEGVSIFIGIRKQGKKSKTQVAATVWHQDLFGTRKVKYESLDASQGLTEGFDNIVPVAPYYLFMKRNDEPVEEYNLGIAINELFPRTLLGPNSHRDDFAIAFTAQEASSRIMDFANEEVTDEWIREKYSIADNRDWKINEARAADLSEKSPVECMYRPFDDRFMLYGSYAFDYPRPLINDELLNRDNLALIFTRQTKEAFSAFVTDKPVGQHKLVTPYDGSYLSPLYIYPNANGDLFGPRDAGHRRPNLRLESVQQFAQASGLTFVPEHTGALGTFSPVDVLDYVYGVLHLPSYRLRYHKLLRIDFPRVPLPTSESDFKAAGAFGRKLRELHLLRPNALQPHLHTRLLGEGSGVVDKPHYSPATKRIFINATQYVEPVTSEVWNYPIGGYQPAEKWLKDRQGRELTFEDSRHYQFLLAALEGMAKLINEQDASLS
jgi:hypothetical protein